MSRMATNEYIGTKRRLYAPADREKRIKILVEKIKHDDGKGYKCKYDKPKAPYQRVLDDNVLTPEQRDSLKAYKAKLSRLDLYRRVRKRLRKIRRIQDAYTMDKHVGKDLSPFAVKSHIGASRHPFGDG